MAEETEELSKDEQIGIASKFEEVAIGLALTPIHCNRFLILPLGDINAIVLGGAAAAENSKTKETRYFANPSVAVTFNKRMAEELIVQLEVFFHISEQDIEAAKKRFKNFSRE
jgi:hypothetical protein